jgi:multidrug efflux pump subunit AcrB
MKIFEKAVDYPRPVLLAALVLCVMGVYSFFKIPQELAPEITVPVALVTIPYPAASPQEVEDEISREVEDVLGSLDDLDNLTTISQQGVSIAIVEFFDTAPVEERVRDVQDALDRVRGEFPEDVEEPIVEEVSFSDIPIVMVTVTGEVSALRLREIAEDLEPLVESVEGVRQVQLFGGREPEMQVLLDEDKVRAYGLTPIEIVRALRAENLNIPGGKLETPRTDFLVRTLGRFADPADIAGTVVATRQGQPVYLREVAEVRLGTADLTSTSRIVTRELGEGKPSVTLQVQPEPGIDILRTVQGVKNKVNAYVAGTGDPITVTYINDETRELTRMKSNLGTNMWQGGLLVVLSLLFTMGMRNALLVSIAIPLSLIVGFFFMFIFGVSLTGIAIFSLILVLGIVVDGALIVGENIYRHVEEGLPRAEAAKKGIAEVGVPVLSADLTTVSAYLPMLLVTGVTGGMLGTIPKVVTFAILGSIFVDHFLLPVISQWFMKSRRAMTDEERAHLRPPLAERVVFQRLRQPYLSTLKNSLKHPLLTLMVNTFMFLIAIGLIGSGTLGFEFFPETDIGRFQVEVEMETGSALRQTDQVTKRIEKILASYPDLIYAVSTVGESGVFDSEFRFGSGSGPEFGKIFVEMTPPEVRETPLKEIVEELREDVGRLPGVKIVVRQREEGPPTGTDIAIRLQGEDLKQLTEYSRAVVDQLQRVTGTSDVRGDLRVGRPELVVDLDRTRAGLYGVRPQDVGFAVQTAFAGISPNDFFATDEDMELRVKYREDQALTVEALEDVLVSGSRNGQPIRVPVGEVAEIRLEEGPSAIYRRNQQRTATVRADAQEGFSADEIKAELRRILEGEGLPAGITVEYAGESEERDKAMAGLALSFGVALLLIFTILVLQFNSFSQPVLVMLTIPLSIVGVVIGLAVTNIPFGFMPMIAVVALSGIVVNDSIVLVSFVNELRSQGVEVWEALTRAAELRFRPVLLTTVTTIFGILPLTLNLSGGGEFWVPLGVSLIFGIATASFLTLLVIPVMYSMLYRKQVKSYLSKNSAPPEKKVDEVP